MAKPIGTVKKGDMPELDDAVEKALTKGEADAPQSESSSEIKPVSQAADVAPGMMRVHIVSESHSDGKYKKTWLRDSVIEIDQYTAQTMIDMKCAYPTSESINEILTGYKLDK